MFPFDITFNNKIGERLTTSEINCAFAIVRDELLYENPTSLEFKDTVDSELAFRVKYFSTRSVGLLNVLRKGKFKILEKNGEYVLKYIYQIGGVYYQFAITILVFAVIGIIATFSSGRGLEILVAAIALCTGVYILFWILALISQGIFFIRVVKKVKKKLEDSSRDELARRQR